jgi:hypothetical protein
MIEIDMDLHDIEKTNLEAHATLCQQRYVELERRLTDVDEKIQRIEMIVAEIHSDLQALNDRHNRKWDATQVAVIGVLIGVIGALLTKILF